MKIKERKKISIVPGWLFTLTVLLFLTGCFVARPYKAPENLVDNSYYRTDQLPEDTLNMASFSWKELFTDNKLQGYIEKALNDNLDIRSAIQRIAIADAYLKQGRAAFFPSLSVGPSYNWQTNSLNTPSGKLSGGKRQYNSIFGLSGNLGWEADIWGKIQSNKDAALANFLQSQAAHQAVKSNLVASIADTYYQLTALDEQKKITEETIANREKSLVTTKALKDAGTLTEVDVKQSEALLLDSRGILVNLNNSIKLMENYFCTLLSIPPQPVDRNTLDEQVISTPLAAGVPVQMLTNRPDVRAAEYEYMTAFFGTNQARAAFYPSLTLTANGGFQSLDFDKVFNAASLFGSLTGSLLQPVFNRRQIRTQYEVAQANQQIAFNDYKKTILQAAGDISNALYNYDAQRQLIGIKREEFLKYDTAVQYSQALVNSGFGNFLNVIVAMQNSLTAELSYVDAKYGRLSGIVQLYRALGGGWK